MLIVNNFNVLFNTREMDFIKKLTDPFEVDDGVYYVDIDFRFQNHYTRDGLLYYVEVSVIQDEFNKPIKRIEKYCVLNMDDVAHFGIKDKEYVFNNIIIIRPNDLKAEDISIKIF